jgi:iron(III) transport system substrate-binding protein
VSRFSIRAVVIAAAILTLAGPSKAADWDQIVQAAKKEGSVVVYTTGLGAKFHTDIAKSFQDKYGITVNLLDLRASEVRERVRMETTTNRRVGDVLQLSPVSLADVRDEGSLEELPSMPNESSLQKDFARNEYSIPSHIYGFGILVNTRLVKPTDEPKSWADLLDDKWRGKILADDFRSPGGGQVFFEVTYDKFGESFHQRLARQNPVFSRELGNSERRVALGEYPIRIPQHLTTFKALKGLPVKFIVPEEGLVYIQFNSAILKGAPHPNAALLLINYYLSRGAQTAIAEAGLAPTIDGITASSSESLVGTKLLGTTHTGQLERMLSLAKQIYK